MKLKAVIKILESSSFVWLMIVAMTAFTIFSANKDLNYDVKWKSGVRITHLNNFYIFTEAYHTLMEEENLYEYHREVHYDYYKYSPTFALFMAPIAVMSDLAGLITWNLLNLLVFLFGLYLLPGLNRKYSSLILFLCLLELLGSIQNEQSNGLMSGLILIFLSLMERGRPFWAIAFLALSVYIKLFSLVFFLFIFFYPTWWKNALYSLFWMLTLFILPAFFTSLDYLFLSYQRWLALLQMDHDTSVGYSVMGIAKSWFGFDLNKMLLVFGSLLLSLIPLLNYQSFRNRMSRYQYAALFFIWVVIFNHKAESPLFIIAMTGISLYFVSSEKKAVDKILLIFAYLLVSLAFSDLVPLWMKDEFFYKFSLKALAPLIIWGKIIFDLVKPKLIHDIK